MQLTIFNFQAVLTKKAQRHGLTENFGQKELRQLKEKYHYDCYGTSAQREMARAIDMLNIWLQDFCNIDPQGD